MKILLVVHTLAVEGDPLGVMQLSAVAKSMGWQTEIATAAGALNSFIRDRHDFVGISMMSTGYGALMAVARAIRAVDDRVPIVVGGAHPTFTPHLVEESVLTAICRGEGERALAEMLRRTQCGEAFDGIPNVATRSTPAVIGRLVENLDELPFVDREAAYQCSIPLRTFQVRTFYTSRGCPYSCSYCFNAGYNALTRGLGRLYRKRSVDSVIEEVNQVAARYPTAYLRFADDTFILKIDEWLEEFARRFPKEVGIPFYCLLRANTISEDMINLLAQAGAKSVCMSIEAANPTVRKEILRRNMPNETIIKAFDAFNARGVNVFTNCMLGFPKTSIQDDIETLDLAIRCQPGYCGFSIATPFPGTELFDYCHDSGSLPENIDFGTYVSTQKGSLLTCFTDEEKKWQKNLMLLGTLVVWKPILRNVVLNYLIKLPTNKAFFLVHFLTKNYLLMTRIVPIRFSVKDVIVLAWDQFRSIGRAILGDRRAA